MKPIPAVRFCWKIPSSRASAPPAMPAIMLATRMVTERVMTTLTPMLSAAAGVSPTARTLSPKRVRRMSSDSSGPSANATYTSTVWSKNMSPTLGMRPSSGMRQSPSERVGNGVPTFSRYSSSEKPSPKRYTPMPLMPCSALKARVTTAYSTPITRPTAALTPTASQRLSVSSAVQYPKARGAASPPRHRG